MIVLSFLLSYWVRRCGNLCGDRDDRPRRKNVLCVTFIGALGSCSLTFRICEGCLSSLTLIITLNVKVGHKIVNANDPSLCQIRANSLGGDCKWTREVRRMFFNFSKQHQVRHLYHPSVACPGHVCTDVNTGILPRNDYSGDR